MSFCLATASIIELWNFRDSSISVKLCWWTSRKSICCRHNSPCRIRRSSSAWAAWSLWKPIFSQYSAIIICLCSSSKVLICAFELFSPTNFPVLSTIFSTWVFSEKLLWALYVFLVTPKLIDWSTFLFPSSCPDPSNTKDDDNWLTDTPSGSLVLGVPVCVACRVSRHPRPCPWKGSRRRRGLMSRWPRRKSGVCAHNLWRRWRRRRRPPSPCRWRSTNLPWRSGCRAQRTAAWNSRWPIFFAKLCDNHLSLFINEKSKFMHMNWACRRSRGWAPNLWEKWMCWRLCCGTQNTTQGARRKNGDKKKTTWKTKGEIGPKTCAHDYDHEWTHTCAQNLNQMCKLNAFCAPRNRRNQRRHWCTCCAWWTACCCTRCFNFVDAIL